MKNPLIHLMLAVLLLLSVVGFYIFWYGAVGKASAESASLAGEIQAKSQTATRVAAAKTELASLAKDETTVNQYFVRTDDVVSFLGQLEKTGKDLGAAVEVVSVAADQGQAQGHITLSLQISGSFDSVLRTVGVIEYGPYDAVLRSMTLDTNGTDAAWTASVVFLIGTQTVPTAPAP